MAGQTIGGLFKDRALGERVLDELRAAGFSTARIDEAEDLNAAPSSPKSSGNPLSDLFLGHRSSGSPFRDKLAQLGISDDDATYFEDGVARGGALVTVRADARAPEAMAILQRNGADLGSMDRSGATSTVGAAIGRDIVTTARTDEEESTADATVQLRAERLLVEKVRVASGTVRIRKRIVSEQQSIDVPVSHEELVIERHKVTGGALGGSIGVDETITIPLSREEVRVGKQTYVTEEVEVGKKAVGGIERITDTVRHEELVVDGEIKGEPPTR